MFGQQHDYQYGTRQPQGVTVDGERKYDIATGVISYFIRNNNVLTDRNQRQQDRGGEPVELFEGPRQLNIEIDDLIFIAKKHVGGSPSKQDIQNVFASFNGLPKYTTAEEYRHRFRFLGQAMDGRAFDNDSQGFGVTVKTSGTGNFINRSNETLMPGDRLTWEPNVPQLDFIPKERKAKRIVTAGLPYVKGRLVKYRAPPLSDNFIADIKTRFPELSKTLNKVSDDPTWAQIGSDLMIGVQDIVGINGECTQPNQWGRFYY